MTALDIASFQEVGTAVNETVCCRSSPNKLSALYLESLLCRRLIGKRVPSPEGFVYALT